MAQLHSGYPSLSIAAVYLVWHEKETVEQLYSWGLLAWPVAWTVYFFVFAVGLSPKSTLAVSILTRILVKARGNLLWPLRLGMISCHFVQHRPPYFVLEQPKMPDRLCALKRLTLPSRPAPILWMPFTKFVSTMRVDRQICSNIVSGNSRWTLQCRIARSTYIIVLRSLLNGSFVSLVGHSKIGNAHTHKNRFSHISAVKWESAKFVEHFCVSKCNVLLGLTSGYRLHKVDHIHLIPFV